MIEKLARVLAVAGMLLVALPVLAQKDLPYGWHKPRAFELGTRTRVALEVHADFDGDGREDTAVILADDRGRAVGVFAFPSSTSRWVKLDSEAVAELRGWQIQLAKPGNYETTCPEDDAACKPGTLTLEHPGIDSFQKGKPHTLFYWDAEGKAFKHVALSPKLYACSLEPRAWSQLGTGNRKLGTEE